MSEGEHEILFKYVRYSPTRLVELTDILLSHAALNALKRHQLQSLSKRYGLKSGGKVSYSDFET